ncbi:glycoside hydrolase family 9 protein [Sphaerotilus sp.]|uniref:glycoside hydrolase family 9 protein n=1 Tax=Sphaerotilus sp. TaxID=2093942 RepID=UPI0025E5DE48|nr:glycoside hydrolase family 9 protein [Sphaerotilus sp.]
MFSDRSTRHGRHPRHASVNVLRLGLGLCAGLVAAGALAQTTAGSLAGVAPAPAQPVLNQLGSKPGWPLHARLVQTERDNRPVKASVIDLANGAAVRNLVAGPGALDADSGDWIRNLDLGAPLPAGRYALQIAGLEPVRFEVGNAVYQPLHRALLRAFYLQRCGAALHDAESGLDHPVCHAEDATLAHADEVNPKGHPLGAAGGWHDAGDYGKYVSTTAVAIARMLAVYERDPARYADDATGIPESGNRTPDLLDEMRIGLDWMLAMQRQDGAVYRKLGGPNWPHKKAPHEDVVPRLVYGVSSPETAKAAATWAQAARLFATHDAKTAARYLDAARRSWAWLEAQSGPAQRFDYTEGDDNGSGPYRANATDTEASLTYDWDDRLWAATELYLTTREAPYLKRMEQWLPQAPLNLFEWKDPSALAMSYLLWHPALQGREDLAAPVRQRILQRARGLSEQHRKSGWGIANNRFVWGSNKMTAEEGITLCMAYQIGGNPQYLAAARDQLHYLLGRNHFGKSFVSGVGSDAVREVSHLWYQVSHQPIPGLFVGGPNTLEQSNIGPKGRGPLSWIDDTRSYATNEFALDYNASLIGLLGELETDCHTRRPAR